MIKKLDSSESVPLTEHLSELRKRLVLCLIVIAVVFGLAYSVSESLLIPFSALIDTQLVFISPTEAFFVHIKVAFYTALGVSVPLFLYQIWAFVAPGLLEKERAYVLRFVIASTLFFVFGATFCYYAVLPFGLKFLIGYGGDVITPMMSIGLYVGFCLNLMFVFGVVFQLPLVVLLLHRLGFASLEALQEFRRYLVVVSFILAAVITPPDVFTQIVLSLPLIILYELTLLFIRFFIEKKEEDEEKGTD